MPHNCVIKGCKNRSNKKECGILSFHALPLADKENLRQWIIKTRLPQRLINRHSRVCSVHFLGEKRSDQNDTPQIFPWTSSRKPPSRELLPIPTSPSFTSPSLPFTSPSLPFTSPSLPFTSHSLTFTPCPHFLTPPHLPPSSPTSTSSLFSDSQAVILECIPLETVKHDHTYCKQQQQQDTLTVVGVNETIYVAPPQSTDIVTRSSHLYVSSSVQCSLVQQSFGVSQFNNNNSAIHFYTGLPDYQTFIASFEFLGNAFKLLVWR